MKYIASEPLLLATKVLYKEEEYYVDGMSEDGTYIILGYGGYDGYGHSGVDRNDLTYLRPPTAKARRVLRWVLDRGPYTFRDLILDRPIFSEEVE